jgi:AAA domain
MVSLSEFADRYLAEHLPPPRDNTPSPTPPAATYPSNGRSGSADRLDETASWADILEPHGWIDVDPHDAAALEGWRRPGATSPVSAKVLKANPHVLVVWSTDAGLPAGADQKNTKFRVYTHLAHNGDESTASKALLRGEAAGLPAHVVEACRGATLPPRPASADDEPPEPDMPNEEPAGEPNQEPEGPRPHLEFRTIRELRAYVKAQGARQYLTRGIWPAGAYGVLAGEQKTQKTYNGVDLAVSVASGTPWLDHFEVDIQGPVLIFAGEGGEGSILRRIDAVALSRGLDPDSLHIVVCARAPHLSNVEHQLEVKQAIELYRPVLVIVDPLYLAARGAELTDLYKMGALLETIQHLCQRANASLMVIHHYNRSRDIKGSARFAGAGPAEWGRVLIGVSTISRYTDPDSQETHVTTELDIIGGEVADQTFRVHRKIRAEDPDDLGSPLHYTVTVTVSDQEAATVPTMPDAKPAVQRVYAILAADQTNALTVREIGDKLAAEGKPLKPRTIQDALQSLGNLVDGLTIDARGTTQWTPAKDQP